MNDGPERPLAQPRSAATQATAVLIFALVGAMFAAGLIGIRFREERARVAALERRLEQQEEQLELLRGRIRGSGTSSLQDIARAISQIRGLDFKREVEPELLSTVQLRARIERSFDRDNERDETQASEDVLRALGLVPDTFDLWEAIRDAHREQIAGFYDSRRERLVVGAADAKDPSPFSRVVLAHEYTHALTDQHFDIGRLDRLEREREDEAATAYLALVEGDAQFTMGIYRDQVLTPADQEALAEEVQSSDATSFLSLPPFLQQALTFPYEEGLRFVQALHEQGGYALVDAAYADPPVSTEQILHPELYSGDGRDLPVNLQMPNVAAALGSGWERIERGQIGELDLRLLAEYSLGGNLNGARAREAAEGWDGGRYVGVRSDAGTVVAAVTAWDSTQEARQAADAFREWVELRYPNGSSISLGGGRMAWGSDNGAGAALRDDDRMLLVVAPDEDSMRRAVEAFPGF